MISEKTLFFVVNSRIGEKRITLLREAIALYLKDVHVEIHCTEYGGHGRELARNAVARGYQIVVAVGGDGTVNEVVQEVAGSNTIMAIVPTGSGNGLARHCSIPLSIPEAVKLLANGKMQSIDLGKANDIYFISNAGVGFDALVCHTIKETKSRGLPMYIRQVVRHYFTYKPASYSIEADGETIHQSAFFLNVANGKEFGYGFQIAPDATLQDGYLDMILVKSINWFNGFRFVYDGWRKKLKQNKNCLYIRAKKISIQSNSLRFFQTDGDAWTCEGNCQIEIYPASLLLWVPQHITSL